MNKEVSKATLDFSKKIECCDAVVFLPEGEDILMAAPEVVSQSVRVHLQNRRQGTVKVKSRSDLVSRSNKKPWRQKGTGRARAGTPRSPLWRGGGVCFGPQPRERVLSINKKMNHCSLIYLFIEMLDAKKVFAANIDFLDYSTKNAVLFLQQNNFEAKKTIILYDNVDDYIYYSFANVSGVKLVSLDSIAPYELANANNILYFKKNEEQFKRVVKQWFGQKI